MSTKQNNSPHSTSRKNFIVPETEEYTCGNCGAKVLGGRYNNHCPHCLWSRHLDDKMPGDRSSNCKAMMAPVGVVQKGGSWRIIHHCAGCHKYTVVDYTPEDNVTVIIELSQKPVPDEFRKPH